LLRAKSKSTTIFSEIISLFNRNTKLNETLNMPGFIEADFIQIYNELWSFFVSCEFNNSKILIEKSNQNKKYTYIAGESEKNIEIRDGFINYILSKISYDNSKLIVKENKKSNERFKNKEELKNKIGRDQETYEAVEGFILTRYQILYFQKCLELNELNEEEKRNYQFLYSKSENDHDLYNFKVFHRADTLRNNFHLHLNKSKNTFYNKETSIELSKEGEIISSEIKPIEESGIFIEEKVIEEINNLLMSLRNYWNSQNQDKVGKPEIKKMVEFEKELGSELKPLKLENGVWKFKK